MKLVPVLEAGDLELLKSAPMQSPCAECARSPICSTACPARVDYRTKMDMLNDAGLIPLVVKINLAKDSKQRMQDAQRVYNRMMMDLPEEVKELV